MSAKMSKAPVYFCIVQAKFNPILAISEYVPKIQDEFRKYGFPDAQTNVRNIVNLSVSGKGVQQQVPVNQVKQYRFINVERTAGFVLDQSALSFQTTEYDVFQTFSAQFIEGMRIAHKSINFSFTERVGLRYLDAVYPLAKKQLSDYLAPHFLGLYGRVSGEISHAFSESVLKVNDTSVTSRAIIRKGKLGFPPDLKPQPLTLPERFSGLNGIHAVLDTDGSISKRATLNIDRIQDEISAIHDEILKAFHLTVTPEALEEWK